MISMFCMTEEEIKIFKSDPLPLSENASLQHARQRIKKAGYWSSNQQMGNRWPIGCVALEITQRCNLDCTICYLSEKSKAVKDLPLEAVFRRIELIYKHYGKNTDVQITGGEPTLRKKDELLAIVNYVCLLGMRPTLMTNGIEVTRSLLKELIEAGLVDIAFHVDTTQKRNGYTTEVELNKIRQQYIEHAKGLPLSVIFTVTVFNENFNEIPAIICFAKNNIDVVRTVSFQIQAVTGRGVQKKRDPAITPTTVLKQIEKGAGTSINFNASLVGHPACSRYGKCLEVNENLYDFFDDTAFIGRMQSATAHLAWDRSYPMQAVKNFLKWFVKNPKHIYAGIKWAGKKLWKIKKDLIASKGRIRSISFIVHNFMDACALEHDRIHSCAFKIITRDGLLPMCIHNAQRDSYILQPTEIPMKENTKFRMPLNGGISSTKQRYTPMYQPRHKYVHLP